MCISTAFGASLVSVSVRGHEWKILKYMQLLYMYFMSTYICVTVKGPRNTVIIFFLSLDEVHVELFVKLQPFSWPPPPPSDLIIGDIYGYHLSFQYTRFLLFFQINFN